jgi:hypothetical protein
MPSLSIADLTACLLLVAICGLFVRGRARLSWAFLAYLVAVFLGNRLVTWWPDRFWNYYFYQGKEATYASLTVLAAFEIALLTFAMFPVARRRATLAMLAVLVLSLAAADLHLDGAAFAWLRSLGLLTPGGQAGRLWLFVIPALVATYYRVPLHPFHRSVLAGFALYLAGYCCLLGFVEANSGTGRSAYLEAQAYLRALDPIAFAASVGVWTWAALRAPRSADAVAPVLRELQPWAVTQ